MPEFRQDLVSGQWVIIATDRAKRPETFACKAADEIDHAALPGRVENCPFCRGNEKKTPPEVLAIGRDGASPPNSAGWRVRVVPNKYPDLEPHGEPRPQTRGDEALFRDMPGYGIHEVLIETPEHNRHPGALPREQMGLVVESYYQRCRTLADNPDLRFIQVFRNHGRAAGASIEHPHSQLIALPFVPSAVRQQLDGAYGYYLAHETCPYCDLLDQERSFEKRMVAENDTFSAFMPYASRYPFETWIVPRRHQSSFLETNAAELVGMAEILGAVLGRLARVLDDPPYNYYLHSAPMRTRGLPHYHWHLELVPKLTTVAGFEMGTGVFINATLPEEAATFMREKGGTGDEAWRKDLLCPGLAQSSARGQSA